MQEFTANSEHRARSVWKNAVRCRLLCHGIVILTCPNMLYAMSVGSACLRMFWEWRQQRAFKAALRHARSFILLRSSENVQSGVHALLFCQDNRICELRRYCCFWSSFSGLLSGLALSLPVITSLWIYKWLAKISQQSMSHTLVVIIVTNTLATI
jgi:Zn-dependent protease with chaperone function